MTGRAAFPPHDIAFLFTPVYNSITFKYLTLRFAACACHDSFAEDSAIFTSLLVSCTPAPTVVEKVVLAHGVIGALHDMVYPVCHHSY